MAPRFLLVLGLAAFVGGVSFAWIHARSGYENRDSLAGVDAAAYAEITQQASTTPGISSAAPAARGSATSTLAAVPILVYHIVRPSLPTDSEGVRKLAVTPEHFDEQLTHLAAAGYHVIRFADLDAHLREGAPLPPKPIVITFDDGWSDQYRYAFPILVKHGYTATFFVFTNAVNHRGFLSWDDLRAMLTAGMTVGDHTRSHPFLTRITDPARLWDEIWGSKRTLEEELGVPVTEFAYPFGQFDATTTALLEKAGFVSARGDYLMKYQDLAHIYALGALNVPTTTEMFARRFP